MSDPTPTETFEDEEFCTCGHMEATHKGGRCEGVIRTAVVNMDCDCREYVTDEEWSD